MRALLVLALLLIPRTGSAQELRWSDTWARTHPASYVAIGVGMAGTLTFNHFYETPDEANLTGPFLWDEAFRASLRAGSEEDRERASSASDVLLATLLLWPLVDSLAVAGGGWGSSDVAWQLTMAHVEVVAADFILGTLVKAFVHRERPHGLGCSREDRRTRPGRCGTSGRTRSFYSGHTSAAFAAAGNVCMSHAFLPLYGDVALDALACGGALLTASIVGVLRMLADRHWSSDVMFGALIGLATGTLLPYALHYGWDLSAESSVGRTSMSASSAPRTFSVAFSF